MAITLENWKRTAALAASINTRVAESGEMSVADALALARAITKSEASISAAIGYVCKGIHRRDAHATAPTAKHKKATPTAAQIAEKHTAQAQAKVARGLAAVAKAEKKTAKQVAKLVKTDERAHREAKPAKAKKARQTKATKPKRQAAKLARPAKKKAHRLEKAPF
jgi:hypothetical protein